jgi:hypothetical protein
MAPLGGGRGASRVFEREARKSGIFIWLATYIWEKAPDNWLKVGWLARAPAPAAPGMRCAAAVHLLTECRRGKACD